MGATQKTHRECCNYCMWYGPVNQDGTMRKHRPATSEDRFGRKVQNRHEDHCQGSHKPYARFGCETEETATVDDQQTSTAPTAADLPKGTRVTGPEGRTGTVNGADVGRVAIKGHASYGREYVGVDWDAVDGDMGLNRRSRPFVDELVIESTPEAPAAPRYITHSFPAGPHTVFAVKDTVTQIDVASFYSQYAARDKRDRLEAGLTTRETREAQLAQEASAAEVTESAPRFVVNQLGSSYFAVRDLVTELDVATKTSRSGAQCIADALTDGTMVLGSLGRAATLPVTNEDPLGAVDFGEPRCVHGFVERPNDRGAAIKACEGKPPAVSVGVFSDEGCVEFFDCAVQASDATARRNVEEEAPADDPAYRWAVLCAEHAEQPKDSCEECAAEGCGAVDADDLDACGECSDCTG